MELHKNILIFRIVGLVQTAFCRISINSACLLCFWSPLDYQGLLAEGTEEKSELYCLLAWHESLNKPMVMYLWWVQLFRTKTLLSDLQHTRYRKSCWDSHWPQYFKELQLSSSN